MQIADLEECARKVFIFWNIQIFSVIVLATILVKNVPEDVLKELKRLKVELGCKTWADLLAQFASSCEVPLVTEEKRRRMKKGVEGLLSLRPEVTSKWKGPPTVLEEIRRSRRHETT